MAPLDLSKLSDTELSLLEKYKTKGVKGLSDEELTQLESITAKVHNTPIEGHTAEAKPIEGKVEKADWISNLLHLLPVAGGVVGGLAGSGFASIPLAGIGAAGGEGWRQAIEEMRGKQKQADPLKIGVEGLTASAGEGGGQAIAKTVPFLWKLPGKAVNWASGIENAVAERATNPNSITLNLANSKDNPIAIQNAWAGLYNKISNAAKTSQTLKGQAVGAAKREGVEAAKSIMGVPVKIDASKYTNVIDDILSKSPENVKTSTKERDLVKYIKNYLNQNETLGNQGRYMTPEEIQKQMDLLDTDFIKWEKGGGASKSTSENKAIAAAKKVRQMMDADLKELYPDTYKSSKKEFENLMDLFSKEDNPSFTSPTKASTAINKLRQIENPAEGITRNAIEQLGKEIKIPVTNEARDIIAAEKLAGTYRSGEMGEPDIGKGLRSIPLLYAKNAGMPYEKWLNAQDLEGVTNLLSLIKKYYPAASAGTGAAVGDLMTPQEQAYENIKYRSK